MISGPGDVLVLRALGLGDALTGIPALRGVRRAWPGRRVTLAAPQAVGSWLRDLGLVDDVCDTHGLDAPLRWARPGHVAVNLHGRGPQSHELLRATAPARLVGFTAAGPPWRSDEHEVDRWCRLVSSAGGACGRDDLRLEIPARPRSREVLLHPGAASAARRWPPERWAALARDLVGRGVTVVLTGGPDEARLCQHVRGLAGPQVQVAGPTSLPQLADLVASARLLVCGDTGVAHLATAIGTPSVLLFGPTSPRLWGPAIDDALHTVLWHGDEATPGDPHGSVIDPALERISVEEVGAAATDLLERSG
ncbi:glycosyltransferase family 9 protein [Cellulomonas sp. URHD0024]|uniref:glycosyltransferase family 9 protein n=1 Tax=Cellulomonas sp. URHD0024 TaxID=1302620 RepID=UPI0004249196|nr:glycosyltransferase family 9 protein [Cellulomonas sp. URHD0024]